MGLNSSLWKKPPVIIFLLKVITSAGSSRPQCSCAQNLPVQPPPVWTSSTKKAQPCWPRQEVGGERSKHAEGASSPHPGCPTASFSEPQARPRIVGCTERNPTSHRPGAAPTRALCECSLNQELPPHGNISDARRQRTARAALASIRVLTPSEGNVSNGEACTVFPKPRLPCSAHHLGPQELSRGVSVNQLPSCHSSLNLLVHCAGSVRATRGNTDSTLSRGDCPRSVGHGRLRGETDP